MDGLVSIFHGLDTAGRLALMGLMASPLLLLYGLVPSWLDYRYRKAALQIDQEVDQTIRSLKVQLLILEDRLNVMDGRLRSSLLTIKPDDKPLAE